MSKEENVLFCRIAVHNQLVSTEDANACLREAVESKKHVGKVMLEEGLLDGEQVKKIAVAVKQKLAQVQKQAPVKKAKPAKAAHGREGEPRPGARRRPVKKQSQAQVAISIASLVVVVLVFGIIAYLYVTGSDEQEFTPETEQQETKKQGEKSGGAQLVEGGVNLDEPKGQQEPVAPMASDNEIKEATAAINQGLMDARSSRTGVSVLPGINSLENALSKYKDIAPKDLVEKAEKELENLKALHKKQQEE